MPPAYGVGHPRSIRGLREGISRGSGRPSIPPPKSCQVLCGQKDEGLEPGGGGSGKNRKARTTKAGVGGGRSEYARPGEVRNVQSSNLPEEATGAQGFGQVGFEDLDCHGSVMLQVPNSAHHRHAAGVDFVFEEVAVGEVGLERLSEVHQPLFPSPGSAPPMVFPPTPSAQSPAGRARNPRGDRSS